MTDSNREQMLTLARDVASQLGMEIVPEPDRVRGVLIADRHGHGYQLREDKIGDPKLTVSPFYPPCSYYVYDDDHNKIEPGEIGVSKSRGAAAIAGDIRRRLEPHYFYRLRKILDMNDRVARSETSRLAEVDRIVGALGSTRAYLVPHLQSEGRSQITVGPAGDGGDLLLGGPGGSVTFERFSVPTEVALRMLAVYREYDETRETDNDG